MKISQSEFNQRWSELHGGAAVEGSVAGWLKISFWIARIFSHLRVPPNLVTFVGVFLSFALLLPVIFESEVIPLHQSLLLLILALICDGIDGSIAIYQGRVTPMGSLYDSIADRISEALWLIFAVYIGLSARYAFAIWILGATQEYARTRLAALGFAEIGTLTPAERPMRAIFIATVIVLNVFGYTIIDHTAIVFIALQIISVLMILKMARSILR